MSVRANTSGFWQQRPVFVTGATGLAGSWLVPALVERGAYVVVLVRDGSPRSHFHLRNWNGGVDVVHGSLCDPELIQRAMSAHSIDTVFHLGAQSVVGVSKVDPLGTFESNIRGTWNLLEAARVSGVKQTVVASSVLVASAEGQQPEVFSSGGTPLLRYPYEISKMCTERIARTYAHTYGMTVGIARFGNLYGGGDLNFSRLITGAVVATLRGEAFRFRTGGLSRRDFLYVEDAVSAYLLLAENIAADTELAQRSFHFGLGRRSSLIDTVKLIVQLSGRTGITPITGSSQVVEVSEEALDITEAREVLHWEPKFRLEEGLNLTLHWFEEHFKAQCAEMVPLGALVQERTGRE